MMKSSQEELNTLTNDIDIQLEAATLTQSLSSIPLNAYSGAHRPNAETSALAAEAGGLDKLKEMTTAFYAKAFVNPQLDQFIRSHDDPHGSRFASWIAEKMGLGTPWSDERRTRQTCPFSSHGHQFETPNDRSSAHYAAWHSPKRTPEKFGVHFKLDDCRTWMRLHFWSCREVGFFDTPFGDYYVKFIAHFVSVYEKTAPMFARESARWSLNNENIIAYNQSYRMSGLVGISLKEALLQLPEEERSYTGSGASTLIWPYTPLNGSRLAFN